MRKCFHHGVFAALVCVCCCFSLSTAATPVQEIRNAQKQMEQGAPEEALAALKELLVDYPESPEVRFGIGCAWFTLGEHHAAAGNFAEAHDAYKEAQNTFEALLQCDNPTIAREAKFNHANSLARKATLLDPGQQYEEATGVLRIAIEAYEAALNEYPGHESIKANLDHVRFQLKQLLQNPPPEQEQPDQQPPDAPPPIFSRFGSVSTQLPNADTRLEDDTAILITPDRREAQP